MFNDKLKDVFNQTNIKKLKTFDTRDGYAFSCEFYIGKTMVTMLHNDGRGGPTAYQFISDEAKKMFLEFVETNKMRQFMIDNGWGFMGTADRISDEDILSTLVEDTIQEKEVQRVINRYQKKGIVYGNPYTGKIKTVSWKASLEQMVVYHRERLQYEINKVKQNLKEDEQILNTNLNELGLTA